MPNPPVYFEPRVLESEIESALHEAAIYRLGSYGWLNENEIDPDFVGHAMWRLSQPSLNLHSLLGEAPVNKRPTEVEKEILTAGEDFDGLMEISRLSIGLALVWQREALESPLNDSPFFWLHYTDAFLKLAIASDRLRDLLIIACSGEAPGVYKKKKPKPRYVTPFNGAREMLAERGLSDQRLVEPLAELPGLSAKLFTYIDRRNAIVHGVATGMARFVRDGATELQQRYDREQERGFTQADWISSAGSNEDGFRLEIDSATNDLKDWYKLLIQTSNHVFQVEYWSRVLGRKTLVNP